MQFYVADVDFSGTFDVMVEAENATEARHLALDEAKKRIKSPHTFDVSIYSIKESDEK